MLEGGTGLAIDLALKLGGYVACPGGIAISYLADARFLLADGFPRGRLFC
jgi:hypothetical protein